LPAGAPRSSVEGGTDNPMAGKRGNATKTRAKPRPGQLLGRLQAGEAAQVLRALLARHPRMAAEAERFAKSVVTDVDVEGIAEDVEQAVLDLNLDDLNARAGRKRWGYVEPTEAAWELLEEAVAPYLDEMRRRIELGLEAAAVAACQAKHRRMWRLPTAFKEQVPEWADLIDRSGRK
jgi:hypothetical protein